MKINICLPKEINYEAINDIAVQVHDCHVNYRPDIFIKTDIIISKDEFINMIDNNEILVAMIDDKVVGYAFLSYREGKKNGYRYRKQVNIEAIGVDEKYRGNGIGSKLLQYIIDYSNENNYTDIGLSVSPENISAKRLYEKFGFKVKNISYSMVLNK